MFYFGDFIEPARDGTAAPWRSRWRCGQVATLRFGARASRAVTGLVRYSFAPKIGDWTQAEVVPSAGAPPGHHLWQATIAPPHGEASCHYEIGYRTSDGQAIWSGRRRVLVFTDAPTAPGDWQGPSVPITPGFTDWRARLHYALLIDRFATGAPERRGSGLAPCDPASPFAAHGGDLAGVLARMDYLAGLGVGALILSPVTMNGAEGYHGYHPVDLYALEPRLGTLDDLRAVVRAAHDRDMAVVLDVVVNHTAPLLDWRTEEGQWHGTFRYDLADPDHVPLCPEALRDPACFHTPEHDGDAVTGRLFGFLDDWRTEDPSVRAILIDTLKYWLAATDVDGMRYDAVRHAEPAFWQAVTSEMRGFASSLGKPGFIQYGEHSSHDPAEAGAAAAAGGFDGMIDYPLYYTMRDAMTGETGPAPVAGRLNRDCFAWPDSRRNLAFLDNHDTSRALGLLGDVAPLHTWLAFLFFGPQVPMIAQGLEQEFDGTLMPWTTPDGRALISDAYVREDMFANPDCVWRAGPVNNPRHGHYDRDNATWRLVARLARLRKDQAGLNAGDRQPVRDGADGLHVWHMGAGADRLLVVVNLTPAEGVCDLPAGEPLFTLGQVSAPDAGKLGPWSAGLWSVPASERV